MRRIITTNSMANTLKILSRPNGNAEEYGRWSVNPYIGCSNGCLYCYLKKGPSGAYLGQDKPVLKKGVVNEEHAYHLAMSEIIANRDEIIRDGGLFMTFTSDPCLLETWDLFCRISESARELGVPVTILTKAKISPACFYLEAIIPSRYLFGAWKREEAIAELLEHYDQKTSLLAIGYTLTGHDELEPKVLTSNKERIRDMGAIVIQLKNCHVWASIEPIIDFPSSLDMICQALEAGCEHFKIGLLTHNTRVVRKDFQFGEHKFKAFDVRDCVRFVEDVMLATEGKATVYWKQSVRDLLCTVYTSEAVDELLDYHHSVGKDFSIFANKRQ